MEFLLDMDYIINLSGLCHYVEYLFLKGLKHTSIRVHLCAIAHGLKVREIEDHTKAYVIQSMMRGAKRLTQAKDLRQPITLDHLNYLIHFVQTRVKDAYIRALYSAVFSWAYHACMRVSEYTEGPTDHNIQIHNVIRIASNGGFAYRIKFETFIHLNFSLIL